VRIHTSIVAAIVTLALVGPAVAGAATQKHDEAGQAVVSSVNVGTSFPGGCALTMTDASHWSYHCSGDTGGSNSAVQADAAGWTPPAGCTLALTEDYLWGYSCTGDSNATVHAVSAAQAPTVFCTLTMAAQRFWTYSCPRGKSGSAPAARSGTSSGAIPQSCKTILETGYLSMFMCPSDSLGRSSQKVQAASTGRRVDTRTVAPRTCEEPLTDRFLSGLLCNL